MSWSLLTDKRSVATNTADINRLLIKMIWICLHWTRLDYVLKFPLKCLAGSCLQMLIRSLRHQQSPAIILSCRLRWQSSWKIVSVVGRMKCFRGFVLHRVSFDFWRVNNRVPEKAVWKCTLSFWTETTGNGTNHRSDCFSSIWDDIGRFSSSLRFHCFTTMPRYRKQKHL